MSHFMEKLKALIVARIDELETKKFGIMDSMAGDETTSAMLQSIESQLETLTWVVGLFPR